MTQQRSKSIQMKSAKALLMGSVSISMLALSQAAIAQDNSDDEVIVTGTRQLIQDSIALKRESTQIVDGLSADEIGDIPALSIGEALETISGVSSHRENGGATEVSIRGLGPFLSSTVVNGRAATNGSGDRSVNFSQFPSELINKLAVFKTQDASQIEGGVAGQIQLDTLKPLDFGKRRIQFDVKGNINPDQLKQDDTEAGDIGYRLTGSYVDQFDVGEGSFGISVGGQISDISQPEAESRQTGPTSNSRPACVISDGLARFTDQVNGGTFTGFSNNPETRDRGDDDCDDFNDRREASNLDQRGSDVEGFDTTIDPATGVAVDFGVPFVFAPSQRAFRQNDTRDRRDSLFGSAQWQPSDRVDINVDAQWSKRTQTEQRNDLTFNGGRRNDTSLNIGPGGTTTTLDSLIATPQGGILRTITDGNIEIGGGDFEREETYFGGGLNVAYDVSERLSVSGDFGYSKTERNEHNREFRIQSDISPVIEFDRRVGDVPLYTLFDGEFDVNDHENFVDRLRVRIDNDVQRENEIFSGRFDANYELGGNFFTNVQAGVRWAEQSYLDLPGGADSGNPLDPFSGRFSFEIENDGELTVNNREVIDDSNDPLFDEDPLVAIIASTRDACRTDFPEGNAFLSSQRAGDLIRNIDDDGTVLSSTNSFATLDAACVAETSAASLNGLLSDINAFLTNPDARENSFPQALGAFSADIPGLEEINVRTIDVRETTQAFYLMTDYETSFASLPVSGNIGVRVVQTDVDATGYRRELIINQADDGELSLSLGSDIEAISTSDSYTEILPSANAIFEIADDKIVRFGAFRALSRADPADQGFGRTFSANSSDDDNPITTLQGLLGNVSGNGNPSLGALTSWNLDVGFEWYPNEDSFFAVAPYFKRFTGGFDNVVQREDFVINGETVTLDVNGIQQVSEDTSNLFGVELSAAHRFSYLPGLLSGFGVKANYNYADSNFEFEDSRYGDRFVTDADGNITQLAQGIIAPGNVPGLSRHVFSGQLYWQNGGFDIQGNYKFRSRYFQPFTSDGTRLRFVDDVGVFEARASYKINDNFRVQVEAINLLSAERNNLAFVTDDVQEVLDYGPRIFFGVRGRF